MLADGRLAAVWLGVGHGVYQADQAIWFSTLAARGWHEAFALSTRETAAGHALAHLSGFSGLQFAAHGERLSLWFNAHGPGLNNHPALYFMGSDDAGRHWQTPRRLPFSAWLADAPKLAGAPLPLADGGSLLPLQGAADWALRTDAEGRLLGAQLGAQLRALSDTTEKNLQGLPESSPPTAPPTAPPPLPCHGPHALLKLADARWLLAGSADPEGSRLRLWHTDGSGQNWQLLHDISASSPTPDTAVVPPTPALQQTPDGRIHLVYVGQDAQLHHVAFTPAWLDAAAATAAAAAHRP